MSYTVGQVSRLSGVSVRTLHHYDATGLASPSSRSAAGYRQYSIADLDRLQPVLCYKELGFPLRHIRDLMSFAPQDRFKALGAQREQVEKRIVRLEAMLVLINRSLLSLKEGIPMTPEEMFEVFGDFDPAKYDHEVRRRWGDTEAYAESARRSRSFSKSDWEQIRDANQAVIDRMIDALDRGIDAEAPESMDLAEEARLLIDRTFYPCSHAMHASLSQMYVSDPRFRAFYEEQRAGLAEWFSNAIRANLHGETTRKKDTP